MGSQLELELDGREANGGGTPAKKGHRKKAAARTLSQRIDRLGSGLLFWAPAWVPAIVVYQLVVYGLVPALAETRRLEGAAKDVEMRQRALVREADVLEVRQHMLADDVYRERVRKSLSVPGAAPLLLNDTAPLDEPGS